MIEMERPRYHPPGNGWQGRFHQIPMEIFRVDWRLKFGKIIFLNEIIEADREFSSAYLLSGNTFPCHNGCSCHTTLRITHIEVEHNQFSIRTQKKPSIAVVVSPLGRETPQLIPVSRRRSG
jgi:hypothetical protein